jgi:hypothetical protein
VLVLYNHFKQEEFERLRLRAYCDSYNITINGDYFPKLTQLSGLCEEVNCVYSEIETKFLILTALWLVFKALKGQNLKT